MHFWFMLHSLKAVLLINGMGRERNLVTYSSVNICKRGLGQLTVGNVQY
uniref:Uncharacterized protein n=1 Tax=Anguilla anguilla TaxID=7936 RepID=A0A0E9RQG2_ANGAN